MCGIAGFLSPHRDGPDAPATTVRRMIDRLAHRGPDDAGIWTDPGCGVALGHRRLAVLDLSETGRQPMLSADGRFVVVTNGEIYNFRELRRALESRGHRFRGTSDTEILVAALGEWGPLEACRRAAGMFAFAAWDRRDRVLHLARDRIGKKPLYCGRVQGRFVFASELGAIRTLPGFEGALDAEALAGFLRYAYVPDGRAIYRGLFKLPPGTLLSMPLDGFRAVGTVEDAAPFLTRFWDFGAVARAGLAAPMPADEEAALSALSAVLGDAVEQRLTADVPLGAFLSGGIDSSLVVALMQERSARPARTFTIGFDESAFDEAPHAAAVARHLNTEHTEIRFTAAECEALVPRLPATYDEPFADSSQLPTLLVSMAARRSLTVVLTGDGGDEVFGGYRHYRSTAAAWRRLRRLPLPVRRAAAAALRRAPLGTFGRRGRDAKGRGLYERALKLADGLDAPDRAAFYRHKRSTWQNPADLIAPELEGTGEGGSGPAVPDGLCFADAMMWADTLGFLPDDCLVKVDRASMSVGLEARSPLLDHRVVELAWRLPRTFVIRKGQGKWILRRLLERHLPPVLFERPKQGFAIPIGDWLRGPLRDWAEDLLSEPRLADAHLRPGPVRRRWAEHLSGQRSWGKQLWTVAMLSAWVQEQRTAPICHAARTVEACKDPGKCAIEVTAHPCP